MSFFGILLFYCCFSDQRRILKDTYLSNNQLNKEHTLLGFVAIWGILTGVPGVRAHVLASIFLTAVSLTDDSKPLTALGMLSAADTDL